MQSKNNATISNFCQEQFPCAKIVIKNLVGGCLAWDLACGGSEERKLHDCTSHRGNCPCPGRADWVFSSPENG